MNNTTENGSAAIPSSTERNLQTPRSKHDHLDALLESLDALVFLQLGVLYLCDNITFFLLLRAVSQVLHVQLRPPALQPTIQLLPVLLANLLCIIAHIIQAKPESTGWALRGYLHGGLIVDFVGELGPISKYRLILLDFAVLGLQLLMLVIGNERQKPVGGTRDRVQPDSQNLEAAEEGRAGPRAARETDDGIELQTLLSEGSESDNARHKRTSNLTQEDEDLIILNIQESLKSLIMRDRASANPAASDSTADRAGLADLLSRIAAARPRAA